MESIIRETDEIKSLGTTNFGDKEIRFTNIICYSSCERLKHFDNIMILSHIRELGQEFF